jgi:hypothetical protein
MAIINTRYLIDEKNWIDELVKQKSILGREPGLEFSLTSKCAQYMWSVSYSFPCCPNEIGKHPLDTYLLNLKAGAVFAYNDDSPKLIVIHAVFIKCGSSILVICEREGMHCERVGFKPWAITEISFWNGFYIHSNLGSYFEKDDANEAFARHS